MLSKRTITAGAGIALLVAAGASSCGPNVQTSSSSSSSSSTSSGAGGGHCAPCTAATDCPAATTLCKTPACTAGCCGFTNAAAFTPCNDNNGRVCDGNGACVHGCDTTADCPPPPACSVVTCENHKCSASNAMDGAPCTASGTTCCGGVCVDPVTDPFNCGACGHSCQGATCNGSSCNTLLALAMNQDQPIWIAVDATNVYWTNFNGGQVMKVAKSGGTPIQLASGQPRPFGIAVDANNVYWANYGLMHFGAGTVMQLPSDSDGGMPTTLASGLSGPIGIAVDATNVYWADGWGADVDGVPIDGGALTQLAANQNGPHYVATDGANLYWTTYNDDTIMQLPLVDGGVPKQLATGMTPPFLGIAVGPTGVYWTQEITGGTVWSVPTDGGAATTIAAKQNQPWGIALDAKYVYWVNNGSGTVMRAPLAGGPATQLASQQSQPTSIAVDSTAVYWTNNGDGTVMKLLL
jgi:sugar lactone lactonase YvrE